jgi:hypothetical protein
MVPCMEDQFRGLAFHALYHDGYDSGLPADRVASGDVSPKGNRYAGELARLSRELCLDIPLTLGDLDCYLDSVGWRPPIDTLGRWGAGNKWCAEIYGRLVRDSRAPRGLGVLVVRQRAGAPDAMSRIDELIHHHGFETLACEALDQQQIASGTRYLRGGNWGKGPYPRSGGPPHTAIVVVDPSPTMPPQKAKEIHPGLENGRALEL